MAPVPKGAQECVDVDMDVDGRGKWEGKERKMKGGALLLNWNEGCRLTGSHISVYPSTITGTGTFVV